MLLSVFEDAFGHITWRVEVVSLIKELIDFLLLFTVLLVVLLPRSMKSFPEGKAFYSQRLKGDVIFSPQFI